MGSQKEKVMKDRKMINGDARVRRVAWERVTKIDDLLRAGKFPNCVMMAREFGVSVRPREESSEGTALWPLD